MMNCCLETIKNLGELTHTKSKVESSAKQLNATGTPVNSDSSWLGTVTTNLPIPSFYSAVQQIINK